MSLSIESKAKELLCTLTERKNPMGFETRVEENSESVCVKVSGFVSKLGEGITAHCVTMVSSTELEDPSFTHLKAKVSSVEDVLALGFGSIKALHPFTLPRQAELIAHESAALVDPMHSYLATKVKAAVETFFDSHLNYEATLSWSAWGSDNCVRFRLDDEGDGICSLDQLINDRLRFPNGTYDCTLDLTSACGDQLKIRYTREIDEEGIPHLNSINH